MRRRISVAAGLVACALAGVAPALAGDPGGRTPTPYAEQKRDLHPEHASGDEPGRMATPLPPFLRRAATQTAQESWRIAPGVHYTRWTQTDLRGPIQAHLLTIDPDKPGVRIDYASMRKVRRVATVRDILARAGAVAGVNGDFYDIGHSGAPLGVGKDRSRGLLHGRAAGWNSAFYVDAHGKPQIGTLPMTATIHQHPRIEVTNLNSPAVAPGGVGIYTARWGRTTGYGATQGQRRHVRMVRVRAGKVVRTSTRLKADRPIDGMVLVGRGAGARRLRELTVGTPVRVGFHLAGRPRVAISGNRLLVDNGIMYAVDDTEMHPRTAVGIDADTGEVLVLVVDGRSARSRGYTMVELANLMIDLGADEALNLDGGGSSTMVGAGRGGRTKVLNTPSDGFERRVANALAITVTKR